jgi:protein-disulfide isomerase
MSTLRIIVLEPDKEKADALTTEAIFATIGLPIVSEVAVVRDMNKIKKYDVTETPALIINDKVRVFQEVPQREEIKQWLHEEFKSIS